MTYKMRVLYRTRPFFVALTQTVRTKIKTVDSERSIL